MIKNKTPIYSKNTPTVRPYRGPIDDEMHKCYGVKNPLDWSNHIIKPHMVLGKYIATRRLKPELIIGRYCDGCKWVFMNERLTVIDAVASLEELAPELHALIYSEQDTTDA